MFTCMSGARYQWSGMNKMLMDTHNVCVMCDVQMTKLAITHIVAAIAWVEFFVVV